MLRRLSQSSDRELANHESESEDFELGEADFQTHRLASVSNLRNNSISRRIRSWVAPIVPRRFSRRGYRQLPHKQPSGGHASRRRRRCYSWFRGALWGLAAVVVLTSLFNPSYTTPPKHYEELRNRATDTDEEGPANPQKQRVFIAASIYDPGGHLLGGAWGKAVLELIDLLGSDNVYLSIYENDGDAANAQAAFKEDVPCRHSIVADRYFVMEDVPHVELPDGSRRVKRIAYLAEVRNKALQPLEEGEGAADDHFDKILYLNDVVFDPVDAAQLLLSTNQDEDGQASYRAACAVDFINPFKFYDTFASRDAEGFSMGVPFFPWFTNSGKGISRRDVLQGKDAVRVKSCWGGMVAFDAKPFRAQKPLRFRASGDLYWDSSECCLIHADLVRQAAIKDDGDTGIYMNPYVRVAYGEKTLKFLHLTRRFERLYTIPHLVVNWLVGLPWFNPRRAEEAGTKVEQEVWVPNSNLDIGGSFQIQEREVQGDGYCGRRGLQLIRDVPREGEKNWETMPVPPG